MSADEALNFSGRFATGLGVFRRYLTWVVV